MEPGGLTLQREIGLLVRRQSSLHKLLLPVMKKSREFIFTWRQEPGGRMLTQGWREAEQTLPGAGGIPPATLWGPPPGPRPLRTITVTAGRSAAVGGRGTASQVSGREGDTACRPTTQQGAVRPLWGRRCDRQRHPGTGREVSVSPSHPSSLHAWHAPAQARTPSSASLSSRSVTASELSPSPPAQTPPLWAARPLMT